MIKADHPKDQSVIGMVFNQGQGHVFRWWDDLSDTSRRNLLDQLGAIDFDLMERLWSQIVQHTETGRTGPGLEPAEYISLPQTTEEKAAEREARLVGEEAIRSGRVAAFLVAGGQGTRLGFDGPKGCYPIGPVSGKSLFQLHAEKIRAAQKKYSVIIPWMIMTSETNDAATQQFFHDNGFFGLSDQDVRFFTQRMIPALDSEGRLILDAKDHIFMSPNGHGGSLLALFESGSLDDMAERGVDTISYFQVDNVLTTIIDPVFIGRHIQAGAEMSSKMVKKRHPLEKVGVFGRSGGKLRVIEYSDLSRKDAEARGPDGSLVYGAGSIATHILNVAFVRDEVEGGFRLPYHVAHKAIPHLNKEGENIVPDTPNGYKFETFVFDALADTTASVIMEVAREEAFSPVKNAQGENSPDTARRDLSTFFERWLEAAGIPIPRNSEGITSALIEVSPLYAPDLEMFLKKVPSDIRFEQSLYLGPTQGGR